jgi:hypothetical protein
MIAKELKKLFAASVGQFLRSAPTWKAIGSEKKATHHRSQNGLPKKPRKLSFILMVGVNMNAAQKKIRRNQIIEQLHALAEWRSECTNEILDCALRENALRYQRNKLDLSIDVLFLELTLLQEKP